MFGFGFLEHIPVTVSALISMAVGALVTKVPRFIQWIKTPAGQLAVNDLRDSLPKIQAILDASGHIGGDTVIKVLNEAIGDLPAPKAIVPNPSPVVKALILGFLALGMAGVAHADINLGGNFGAGGAVYAPTAGGSFVATGTLAVTYGLNFAIVSTVTPASPTQYNYLIFSVGGSYEPHTVGAAGAGGYLGSYAEIGTAIPDTPDNIMVGTIGDFFTGAPNPFGIIVAVNFPLGQPWKTWK